jgi:hypothetical protein
MLRYMEPPKDRLDLLHKYYTHIHNHTAAARIALQLALFKGPGMVLKERMTHLTTAFHHAMDRANTDQDLTVRNRISILFPKWLFWSFIFEPPVFHSASIWLQLFFFRPKN